MASYITQINMYCASKTGSQVILAGELHEFDDQPGPPDTWTSETLKDTEWKSITSTSLAIQTLYLSTAISFGKWYGIKIHNYGWDTMRVVFDSNYSFPPPHVIWSTADYTNGPWNQAQVEPYFQVKILVNDEESYYVNESQQATEVDWSTEHGWAYAFHYITETEKAFNPTPSDNAYGVSLNLPYLVWEHPSDSVTFDVYFKQASGEVFGFYEKIASGISDKFIYLPDVIDYEHVFPSSGKIAPLDYGEQPGAGEGYYWRVDVRYSEENIVQGDIWSFSTLALQPPLPDGMEYDKDTKELVESTSGLTGRNAMTTLRRLVAFAKNSVFYET